MEIDPLAQELVLPKEAMAAEVRAELERLEAQKAYLLELLEFYES